MGKLFVGIVPVWQDLDAPLLPPKDVEKIVPKSAYKIDFTSAKTKKRQADQSFQNAPLNHSQSKKVTKVKECTEEEKLSF